MKVRKKEGRGEEIRRRKEGKGSKTKICLPLAVFFFVYRNRSGSRAQQKAREKYPLAAGP